MRPAFLHLFVILSSFAFSLENAAADCAEEAANVGRALTSAEQHFAHSISVLKKGIESPQIQQHPRHNPKVIEVILRSVTQRIQKRASMIQEPSARAYMTEELVRKARDIVTEIYTDDLTRKRVPGIAASDIHPYANLVSVKTMQRLSLHPVELKYLTPKLQKRVETIAALDVRGMAGEVLPDLVENIYKKTKQEGRSEEERLNLLRSLQDEIFELLKVASLNEAKRLKDQDLEKDAADQSRVIKFVSQRLLPRLGSSSASPKIIILESKSPLHEEIIRSLLDASPRVSIVNAVAEVLAIELEGIRIKIGLPKEMGPEERSAFLEKFYNPLIHKLKEIIRAYDLEHAGPLQGTEDHYELQHLATSLATELWETEFRNLRNQSIAALQPGVKPPNPQDGFGVTARRVVNEEINRRIKALRPDVEPIDLIGMRERILARAEEFLPLEVTNSRREFSNDLGLAEVEAARGTIQKMGREALERQRAIKILKTQMHKFEVLGETTSPIRRRILEESLLPFTFEVLDRVEALFRDPNEKTAAIGSYFDKLFMVDSRGETETIRGAVTAVQDYLGKKTWLTFGDRPERWAIFKDRVKPALRERDRYESRIYGPYLALSHNALPREEVTINYILQTNSMFKRKMRHDLSPKAESLGKTAQQYLDESDYMIVPLVRVALANELIGQAEILDEVELKRIEARIIEVVRNSSSFQKHRATKTKQLEDALGLNAKSQKISPQRANILIAGGHKRLKIGDTRHMMNLSARNQPLFAPEEESKHFSEYVSLENKIYAAIALPSRSKTPITRAARQKLIYEKLTGADISKITKETREDFEKYRELERIAIERNLGLVFFVAEKQYRTGNSIEDLIQIGNEGLLRAVRRFNPATGFKFSTFGFVVIKNYISRYAVKDNGVFKTKGRSPQLAIIMAAKTELRAEGNIHPTYEDIAIRTGLSEELVERWLIKTSIARSLDTPFESDSKKAASPATTLAAPDEKKDPNKLEKQALANKISTIVFNLEDERTQKILIARLNLERQTQTLESLSKELGIGKERVRQLEVIGLRRVRGQLLLQTSPITDAESTFIQAYYFNSDLDPELDEISEKLEISPARAKELLEILERRFQSIANGLF